MLRKIGVFVLALLLFSGCANAAGYDGRAEDEELKGYIRELCEAYGIPETLVFAVIEKESSWNADAVNYNDTCFGLMQISVVVKAKLFCPEIAGLFCRIAGLFCHDSRANLSLKPVCFGIAIS